MNVSSNPPSTLRLPARFAILGSLFVVELLLISMWLDAELLRGRGFLASMVHDWGAWSLHLGVALALGSLIFAESRAESAFERISADCSVRQIDWRLLGAHLAGLWLFVWVSMLVFHERQEFVSNALMLVWAVIGLASLTMAACALIPGSVWRDIFRSTGDAWIYGLAAAVVAVILGVLAQKLWIPLSHWTLSLVATMLRPFVPILVENPATMMIGTPAFHQEIAPQCSGYEGMGLILAFSAAWLWFFRKQWRFPQALILLPAGVVLMFIVNSMRIAGLILIGNAGAPQIALGGFHSQAGWMGFNAVAIGMCVLARRIPALAKTEEAQAVANPTAAYLMPFLAILGAAMLARSMSGSFEWAYGLRVAAAAGALWYFRRSYRNLDFRFGLPGIAAGVAVFAIWIALEPPGHSSAPPALMASSAAARISWVTLRILGAVLMVPIAEELAFRGFLLRRLINADFESVGWNAFAWVPFIISSVAFGILHGDRWLAAIFAGALFALIQIRRGRIGEAIAAHAIANLLIAVWVLIGGNWQLW